MQEQTFKMGKAAALYCGGNYKFFLDIIVDVAYYVGRFSGSSWEQNVFRPMIHSNDIDLSKVQLNEVEYPILI
jgi:hypothetical protein